jgi:Histone H1-like nucleoprotein HC2
MVLDALRGYAQLANGLTDVTRQRASEAARSMVEQSGDLMGQARTVSTADLPRQVQALAEDLLAVSRTNRDLLVGLIRTEIERAIARFGLVGADELAAMVRIVERLQNQLDAAIAFGGRGTGQDQAARTAGEGGPQPTPARTVKRAPETFGRPTKTTAAKTTSTKSTAKKATAKKTTAKKTTAKKTTAKKTTAKKTTAKKATAKKATAETTSAPAMTTQHATGSLHDAAPPAVDQLSAPRAEPTIETTRPPSQSNGPVEEGHA